MSLNMSRSMRLIGAPSSVLVIAWVLLLYLGRPRPIRHFAVPISAPSLRILVAITTSNSGAKGVIPLLERVPALPRQYGFLSRTLRGLTALVQRVAVAQALLSQLTWCAQATTNRRDIP